jgi:zinc/manganese transport system substrate-binding protein
MNSNQLQILFSIGQRKKFKGKFNHRKNRNCFYSISCSLSFFFFFLTSLPALAKNPKLITTTTDLAWMAQQIAGPDVDVESLLNGREDPHFVDARPDYIHRVSQADALCQVGLDLEVGWLPKVVAKAGRAHLQAGGKGYCEAGTHIEVLEKPAQTVDRSMGDMHPSGNPHFWLSPVAMSQASFEILETLIRINPEKKLQFSERHRAFLERMKTLQREGLARLKAGGVTAEKSRFLEYHREFSYFAKAFQLESLGSLEEKPGVSPSAGRLAYMSKFAKSEKVNVVLATPHSPRRLLSKFQELSQLKVKVVPVSLNPSAGLSDYAQLLERIQTAYTDALLSSQDNNQIK